MWQNVIFRFVRVVTASALVASLDVSATTAVHPPSLTPYPSCEFTSEAFVTRLLSFLQNARRQRIEQVELSKSFRAMERPFRLWIFDKNGTLTRKGRALNDTQRDTLERLAKTCPEDYFALISSDPITRLSGSLISYLSDRIRSRLYVYSEGGGHGFLPGQLKGPIFNKPLSTRLGIKSALPATLRDSKQLLTRYGLTSNDIYVYMTPWRLKIMGATRVLPRPVLRDLAQELSRRIWHIKPQPKLSFSTASFSLTAVSKADAFFDLLNHVSEKLRITPEQLAQEVVGFGDSFGDIPLLNAIARAGGTAFWVGPGVPEGLHFGVIVPPLHGRKAVNMAIQVHLRWLRRLRFQRNLNIVLRYAVLLILLSGILPIAHSQSLATKVEIRQETTTSQATEVNNALKRLEATTKTLQEALENQFSNLDAAFGECDAALHESLSYQRSLLILDARIPIADIDKERHEAKGLIKRYYKALHHATEALNDARPRLKNPTDPAPKPSPTIKPFSHFPLGASKNSPCLLNQAA